MDRHILNKLQFLEQHPDVDGYQFFTNFTISRQRDIDRLLRLQKLERLTISVYGHDLESFVAIAEFDRENLPATDRQSGEALRRAGRKEVRTQTRGLRSTRAMPRRASGSLLELVDGFERAGVAVRRSRRYNNWGGLITPADVEGLGIDIKGAESVYKNCACVLLFTVNGLPSDTRARERQEPAQPDERLRPPDIAIVERLGELELKSLRDEVAHVAEDRSGAPKYEWCRPISCILRRVDRVEAVFLRSLTSSSGAVMARRPPPWRRSGRRRYGRAPSAPVPARRCGKGRLRTRSGSRTRSRRCAP